MLPYVMEYHALEAALADKRGNGGVGQVIDPTDYGQGFRALALEKGNGKAKVKGKSGRKEIKTGQQTTYSSWLVWRYGPRLAFGDGLEPLRPCAIEDPHTFTSWKYKHRLQKPELELTGARFSPPELVETDWEPPTTQMVWTAAGYLLANTTEGEEKALPHPMIQQL